jgi:adenosylcobinamide-phosphate synthase
MSLVAVLLLALALDLLFGEPPTEHHPVGWIGRLIAALEARAPRRSPRLQVLYGVAMVVFAVALVGGLCYVLLAVLYAWSPAVHILLAALLLKSTFAVRALLRAAGRVKLRLLAGDLPAARDELRALVSRDTSRLGPAHLAAAAVESVAENAVDSFVAPILFFLVAAVGLRGAVDGAALAVAAALAYRVANTFDSMVGYHGCYEYLGKFAARFDDLLNWLPARLGALCLIAAAAFLADAGNAWRVMRRDHGRTESPNAGWTMSAAAGALGVTLEKVGHYTLGDGGPPGPAAIERVSHLALAAILLFAGLCAIILLLVS